MGWYLEMVSWEEIRSWEQRVLSRLVPLKRPNNPCPLLPCWEHSKDCCPQQSRDRSSPDPHLGLDLGLPSLRTRQIIFNCFALHLWYFGYSSVNGLRPGLCLRARTRFSGWCFLLMKSILVWFLFINQSWGDIYTLKRWATFLWHIHMFNLQEGFRIPQENKHFLDWINKWTVYFVLAPSYSQNLRISLVLIIWKGTLLALLFRALILY